MITELIHNKVYYKIFDKTHDRCSLVFDEKKVTGEIKLTEIERNKQLVIDEFLAKELVVKKLSILKQIHSNKVIDTDINYIRIPAGDGLVTSQKGIILAIKTADCVPVLFFCSSGIVIGAAHCGWSGAKDDIIKNIITMMIKKGATDIKAIIGPAICQDSYEVGAEYYNIFIKDSIDYKRFFIPSVKQDRYMFDLPSFVKYKLRQEQVTIADHINEDTYSNENKYPSYRRHCHKGEKYWQNILTTIIMK